MLLIIACSIFLAQYIFHSPIKNYNSKKSFNLYPSIKSNIIKPSVSPAPKVKKTFSDRHYVQIKGEQLLVPILMYHYIGFNPDPKDTARDILSTTPDKFKDEMKFLKDSGYTTITLDTLYAALKKQVKLPDKAIILTFDDGYIDFYYNAYPILKEFNFSATVFIPTGLMDQGPYLRWSQIKDMQSSGLISYGAHTIHHYSLTSISNDQVWIEISESKKVLEEKLGIPINFMSYPTGTSNSSVANLTQKAGYIGAVGTWYGKIQSEGTIFNMPRVRINGNISLQMFKELILN